MGRVKPTYDEKHVPKGRDRKIINRVLHDARHGNDPLSMGQVRRAILTSLKTNRQGNFNRRDKVRLHQMLNAITPQAGSIPHRDTVALPSPLAKKAFKLVKGSRTSVGKPMIGDPLGLGPNGGLPKSHEINRHNGGKGLGWLNYHTGDHFTKKQDQEISLAPKDVKRRQHKGPVGNNRGNGGPGGGGKGNFSQANMLYYGLGNPPKVGRRRAATVVGRDINQQIGGLINQIQDARNSQQFDVNNIKNLYDRTSGDLNYVYGEAADGIQGQTDAINKRFGLTKDQLTKLAANLNSTIQQNSQTNATNAQNELNRLGIGQMGLGQYGADAANNQQVANTIGQNQLANLAAAQQNEATIGSLLQSMTAASKASALGQATNARQDALSQSRQDYRNNVNDILNQIDQAKSGRGNAINELHTAMQQNAFQQWLSTQQQDFNNQLAANQFNLDVSKLNSDNLWNKAKLKQQAAQEAAKRKQIAQFMAMQKQNKKNAGKLSFLLNSSLLG